MKIDDTWIKLALPFERYASITNRLYEDQNTTTTYQEDQIVLNEALGFDCYIDQIGTAVHGNIDLYFKTNEDLVLFQMAML